MPASEIDDIFSGKSKSTSSQSSHSSKKRKVLDEGQPSTSKTTLDAPKKKKKKKTAGISSNEIEEKANIKHTEALNVRKELKESTKTRVVETVVDTSLKLTKGEKDIKSKRSKNRTNPSTNSDKDGLEKFQDSRGSASRRRTEEGFLIYKEEELGISNGGGDTPLCPFDCECCF
ncbi:DUF1764-domain-containing protein [Schizopora paradoxa]|uniref:DUF1764-domain-containing protein n=1 Tax=Schizopora paradoxa TaxID=27342 RepID=A0A0H2S257_9AGAM|nr:DUF1764-domain-containing protein [Schizopora paradoxa]